MDTTRLRRTGALLVSAALLTSLTTATVAAQDEETTDLSTPVYFTWSSGEPASVIEGTFDQDAGELRGAGAEGIAVEASDPRVSGLAYVLQNGNREIGADTTAIFESRSYRLVNDDGAWTGPSTFVQAGDPSVDGPPAIVRETAVLIGEGAYEGLTAFFTGDYREGSGGEGIIYGVAVPPVPDVPDAPAE